MNGNTEHGGGPTLNSGREPRSGAAEITRNVIGGLMVLALAAVANNLWQVNLTLAASAVTSVEQAKTIAENKEHLKAHDDEIGQIRRDIAAMGGPNFRGPQDFLTPSTSRGR